VAGGGLFARGGGGGGVGGVAELWAGEVGAGGRDVV